MQALGAAREQGGRWAAPHRLDYPYGSEVVDKKPHSSKEISDIGFSRIGAAALTAGTCARGAGMP